MEHLLNTELDTLALLVLLPAMLGLIISGAHDAMRRDRRGWITGKGWMEELTEEDK